MIVCKTRKELAQALAACPKDASIGLVPTMGALHEGHASLFKRARAENDVFVASVFVNPIQFNNPEDLRNYPRDFEADRKLLEANGCDIVFAPSVEEMYPEGEPLKSYSFGSLETVMEGAQRPGHFKGVGVVVGLLFELVNPTRAYFGEKDFQQVAVIQDLVRQMGIKTQIVPCPIKRYEDGLAQSSRNALLTPEHRALAPKIYATLKKSKEMAEKSCKDVKDFVCAQIAAVPEMKLEYFEIARPDSLQTVPDDEPAQGNVGFIVVWMGKVRLIDNIRY
ncbi:MAG: pantoate--beta-alanine ligase [Bacteroides sp.]|nr:pantoate--beta-alanine ligase [Bacteroides sp.]MCM1086000.1 pantoate--beta-alanine ligase [Bacteroides sp.]